jgi:amino acid permease
MAKPEAVDHKFWGLYACNKDFPKKKRTPVQRFSFQQFSCKVVSSGRSQRLTQTKQKSTLIKKNSAWILELVKNWGAGLLSTISSIHSMFSIVCLPFSKNLSIKDKRKHSEKDPQKKKKKTKKWATLKPSLTFDSPKT